MRVGAVGWRGPQGHDVSSVAAAERPSREATRGAPQWGRFRGDGADLENIVDDKSGPGRGGGDVRKVVALALDDVNEMCGAGYGPTVTGRELKGYPRDPDDGGVSRTYLDANDCDSLSRSFKVLADALRSGELATGGGK